MTDSQYLDLEQGVNKAWITGIKFEHGSNEKPRPFFKVIICRDPSSVSHTSPFTNLRVSCPVKGDDAATVILMEKKIKAILYPLAGLKPEEKTSLKTLMNTIHAGLEQYDYEAEVIIEKREGKGVDRNGAPIVFDEPLSLNVVSYAEKKAYEASIDADDLPDAM